MQLLKSYTYLKGASDFAAWNVGVLYLLVAGIADSPR